MTTPTSEGSTTATTIMVLSTDVPTTERTITTSTELNEPATGPSIFDGFIWDARAVGVEIYFAVGEGPPPREFTFKAHVTPDQSPTAYQALAEKLLSLAGKHKQEIYFDRLHMILVTVNSQVVYDHTFQVTPPSSTSTTLPFQVFYSAPRLQVTPREGVSLEVTVSKGGDGQVLVIVEITNRSPSVFHFSREDLQLYLNGVRVEPTQEGADAPTEIAAGDVGGTVIYFTPAQFDPYSAGLLYISSDPGSQGFTASDGPTP